MPGRGTDIQSRRPYFSLAPNITTINKRDGDGESWYDALQLKPDKWFDTSCFKDPAQFQFGNYRIGDVHGPSVFNTDFSAAKRTEIGRASVELRADVFNLFNRAHFSNPNVTFGNTAFGRISATRLPAREAQFGVRVLF